MDSRRLRESAEELETVLTRHQGEDRQVDLLHAMLRELIQEAIAEKIAASMGWTDIPGDRPFAEGEYSQFPDVEDAYSRFKFLLSDSEDLLDSLPSQRGKG